MTRARGAELLASATRSRTEPAPDGAGTAGHRSPAYRRVEGLLSAQECVILDGGIATELEELEIPGYELRDDSVADLTRLGEDIERSVLARAVTMHLEDRTLVYENKTIVF